MILLRILSSLVDIRGVAAWKTWERRWERDEASKIDTNPMCVAIVKEESEEKDTLGTTSSTH